MRLALLAAFLALPVSANAEDWDMGTLRKKVTSLESRVAAIEKKLEEYRCNCNRPPQAAPAQSSTPAGQVGFSTTHESVGSVFYDSQGRQCTVTAVGPPRVVQWPQQSNPVQVQPYQTYQGPPVYRTECSGGFCRRVRIR